VAKWHTKLFHTVLIKIAGSNSHSVQIQLISYHSQHIAIQYNFYKSNPGNSCLPVISQCVPARSACLPWHHSEWPVYGAWQPPSSCTGQTSPCRPGGPEHTAPTGDTTPARWNEIRYVSDRLSGQLELLDSKQNQTNLTVKSFYFVGYLIMWNSWARRSTNFSTHNIKSPRLDFRIYL